MSRHDEIRASYKQLGGVGSMYDGIITRSSLLGKLMDSLIWGLDATLAAKWINDALAPVPPDFSGKLLEVPVGTGVLTMPLYKSLPDAGSTCLDYSADMMKNAERRASAMGVKNVSFVQGDVGALPFEDESFDIVLSLNGFHAFPDKDAAFRETRRVLKQGGIFLRLLLYQRRVQKNRLVRETYVRPQGLLHPAF